MGLGVLLSGLLGAVGGVLTGLLRKTRR